MSLIQFFAESGRTEYGKMFLGNSTPALMKLSKLESLITDPSFFLTQLGATSLAFLITSKEFASALSAAKTSI